jgi:hypothetical protein
MAVSLVSTGVTFPDSSTQTTAATGFGFKNRIINGAMVIDQRNAGAAITATGFPVDRWNFYKDTAGGSLSVQRSSTAPSGFINSIGLTVTTSITPAAGEGNTFMQPIEGFNVADLGWGAAGAQAVTVSFWVRSSLTGTFGGSITNSANNRSYPFTYTISAANTFEYKTVTIAGDTSGTWLKDNGVGIRLWFGLGVGSSLSGTAGSWAGAAYLSATGATSVVGTNGATFYITGVQLEKGSTATSFDYRPYGTELALCQRYYQGISNATNFSVLGVSSGSNIYTVFLIAPLRAAPTFSGDANIQQYYFNSAGGTQLNQAVAYASLSFGGGVNQVRMVTPNAGANGLATWFDINSGSIQISAEL